MIRSRGQQRRCWNYNLCSMITRDVSGVPWLQVINCVSYRSIAWIAIVTFDICNLLQLKILKESKFLIAKKRFSRYNVTERMFFILRSSTHHVTSNIQHPTSEQTSNIQRLLIPSTISLELGDRRRSGYNLRSMVRGRTVYEVNILSLNHITSYSPSQKS